MGAEIDQIERAKLAGKLLQDNHSPDNWKSPARYFLEEGERRAQFPYFICVLGFRHDSNPQYAKTSSLDLVSGVVFLIT